MGFPSVALNDLKSAPSTPRRQPNHNGGLLNIPSELNEVGGVPSYSALISCSDVSPTNVGLNVSYARTPKLSAPLKNTLSAV